MWSNFIAWIQSLGFVTQSAHLFFDSEAWGEGHGKPDWVDATFYTLGGSLAAGLLYWHGKGASPGSIRLGVPMFTPEQAEEVKLFCHKLATEHGLSLRHGPISANLMCFSLEWPSSEEAAFAVMADKMGEGWQDHVRKNFLVAASYKGDLEKVKELCGQS